MDVRLLVRARSVRLRSDLSLIRYEPSASGQGRDKIDSSSPRRWKEAAQSPPPSLQADGSTTYTVGGMFALSRNRFSGS